MSKWDITKEEVVAGGFLKLLHITKTDGNKERVFSRIGSPDWVQVVMLQPDLDNEYEKVLMVKQYRHGNDTTTIEFPSGIVDEGEEPLQTAHREMLEETGCVAKEMIYLGSACPNPAIMNNQMHTFLALGYDKVAELDLDPDEEIELVEMELSEVMEGAGDPPFTHSLLFQSLFLLDRYLGGARYYIESKRWEGVE